MNRKNSARRDFVYEDDDVWEDNFSLQFAHDENISIHLHGASWPYVAKAVHHQCPLRGGDKNRIVSTHENDK